MTRLNPPEKIGRFPTWKEGPAPFVYADKPLGERCAWSIKWGTNNGVVLPSDWFTLDDCPSEWIYYELVDLANRTGRNQRAAQGILEGIAPDTAGTLEIKRFLKQARASYKEYLAPWNLPSGERIMGWIFRPGWGPEDLGLVKEYQEALEQRRRHAKHQF